MDFRKEYRAVSHPNIRGYWLLEYRHWFAPFWVFFGCASSIEDALEECVRHATPIKREIVNFGRLPERQP